MSRRLIHARRSGFTIIEILIAIVVLVLGITGIVALFPTAIESGNQTVEDTYSATITQSVVDAISVGLRESRYSHRTTDRVWTYFILNHDGVMDAPVRTPENFVDPDPAEGQIWRKDYCVVLPQGTTAQNNDTANEVTFVYPLPTLFENSGDAWLRLDQRDPGRLATGNLTNANFANTTPGYFRRQTAEGQQVLWFPRVYHLGRYRVGDPNSPISAPGVGASGYDTYVQNVRQVREEYRGENIASGITPGGEETIAVDPYPNYSFAFSLKRARVDTTSAVGGAAGGDGRITQADFFSNSLYELKVYIFKNFNLQIARDLAGTTTGGGDVVPRTNRPVRRFITLMSL